MQDWEKIKDELNSIRLKGCEEVRLGDVLHYSLKFYYDDTYDIVSAIKSIRRMIGYSFLTTYTVQKIGEGNNVFFLSSSISNRIDHIENMRKVMSVVDNRIDIVSSNYRISIGNLCYFPIIFSWNKSLKKVFPNRIRRMFYISHLYRIFLDYQWIKKKISGMNLKSFVTYCDVLEIDNYFTQMMNYHGITTVTLQHGMMSSEKWAAWAVLGARSNYFFCQGKYMLDVAERLNADVKNCMKVVGLASYADSKERFFKFSDQQKTLGVMLSGNFGKRAIEINKDMIRIASKLGDRMGIKILYKMHPTSKREDYSDVISDFEVCFGKEINIKDFINMIDIGMVYITTSMEEMLYNNKLVCIYKKDNTYFDFCKWNITTGFENLEELHKILTDNSKEEMKEMLDKMRSYFISDEIPFYAYKKAFAEIGVR